MASYRSSSSLSTNFIDHQQEVRATLSKDSIDKHEDDPTTQTNESLSRYVKMLLERSPTEDRTSYSRSLAFSCELSHAFCIQIQIIRWLKRTALCTTYVYRLNIRSWRSASRKSSLMTWLIRCRTNLIHRIRSRRAANRSPHLRSRTLANRRNAWTTTFTMQSRAMRTNSSIDWHSQKQDPTRTSQNRPSSSSSHHHRHHCIHTSQQPPDKELGNDRIRTAPLQGIVTCCYVHIAQTSLWKNGGFFRLAALVRLNLSGKRVSNHDKDLLKSVYLV